MNRDVMIRKTIFSLFYYGFYCNLIFLLLKPVIYQDPYYLTYILIFFIAGVIDTYIRPLETENKEEGAFLRFILLLFFASPWLLVLAILEQSLFFNLRSPVISLIGLCIYLLGAIILLMTRIQLGKQATGTLVIVKDHELIQSGLYRYIRHPMYLGTLVGVIGFALVSQAIIVPTITFILHFWIFHNRIIYEESILVQKFGKAYSDYMLRTKRLVPFVY